MQTSKREKDELMGLVQSQMGMMKKMEETMRKKDESLRLLDDRKITIDILIYKIKQMNLNFHKEKLKITHNYTTNANNLLKEIDQLRSNLRSILFEDGKRIEVRKDREKAPKSSDGTMRRMLMEKLSSSQVGIGDLLKSQGDQTLSTKSYLIGDLQISSKTKKYKPSLMGQNNMYKTTDTDNKAQDNSTNNASIRHSTTYKYHSTRNSRSTNNKQGRESDPNEKEPIRHRNILSP